MKPRFSVASESNKSIRRTYFFLVPLILTLHYSLVRAGETGVMDQKLDHSNPSDTRTFQEHFFFEDKYASGPDAPVFFYTCGEDPCIATSLGSEQNEVIQQFNGYGVVLEHRYFGKSFPFVQYTTDNLRYLTVQNAIEDAADFIVYLKKTKGLTGKWITLGGSYSGDVAAFVRLRHPELVAGAWASSAPVQSRTAFTQYDESLAKTAGSECSQKVTAVTQEVQLDLLDPKKAQAIKAQFGASDLVDNGDVLYWLADIAAAAIQYGMRDQFCNALLSSTDPVQAYGQMTLKLKGYFGITAATSEVQGSLDLDPTHGTERAWYYLGCTEFGNWQDANPDRSLSLRASAINQDYDRRICQRLFGIDPIADPSIWNNRYYLPLLDTKTSNIFFTNGSNDPWLLAGISAESGNNTNPNTVTYTIQGGAHADDTIGSRATDSAILKEARAKLYGLVEQWIK